jgi:hypothetical protein
MYTFCNISWDDILHSLCLILLFSFLFFYSYFFYFVVSFWFIISNYIFGIFKLFLGLHFEIVIASNHKTTIDTSVREKGATNFQNTIQTNKDWASGIPLKTDGELRYSWRISRLCISSDTVLFNTLTDTHMLWYRNRVEHR